MLSILDEKIKENELINVNIFFKFMKFLFNKFIIQISIKNIESLPDSPYFFNDIKYSRVLHK